MYEYDRAHTVDEIRGLSIHRGRRRSSRPRETTYDGLDESAQRDVEVLQVGEQLRHGRPIPGEAEPADRHNGEQLVGARSRLRQSISVSQARHHLERIHLHVRLLAQRRQFPQENSEGPLEGKTDVS